jgi:carboxylate-amine ligase
VDHGRAVLAPVADLVEELIELVRGEAEALGCLREVAGARRIAERGTSAVRQRAAYRATVEAGADHAEALAAVVDQLVAEFTRGLDRTAPTVAVAAARPG